MTVAVWMDGDNSLESLIPGDLDELEAGLAPGVAIDVEVDRSPEYAVGDGDWTGARRIEIAPDDRPGVVSPVVEDLGEVDMGSGDALADFLLWVDARHPADRLAVILWDHGGGYWIAQDDTDHDRMRIEDELPQALQAVVDARGAKIDVLGFDACNMAEWEVAHAIRDQVRVLAASEAWVGNGGYAYDQAFADLPEDPTPEDLGERLAWSAGDLDGELTHAAIDLDREGELSSAVDRLAGAFLSAPVDAFVDARGSARGLDPDWGEYWMDLGDLARASSASADPGVADAARGVVDALDRAVIASYAQPVVGYATGLTVFADTSHPAWLARYDGGPWAADTRWDEVLARAAADGR